MFEPVTAAQMKMDYAFCLAPESARIIAAYAVEHNVLVSDLRGPGRRRPLVRVRQAVMAKLRAETDLSLPAIGRLFDRDHTTVLHSLRAVEKRATPFPDAAPVLA